MVRPCCLCPTIVSALLVDGMTIHKFAKIIVNLVFDKLIFDIKLKNRTCAST